MIPKQLHEGLLFVVYQVRARSEALKDHAGLRIARAQQGQLLADFVAKVGCCRSAVGHFVERGRH